MIKNPVVRILGTLTVGVAIGGACLLLVLNRDRFVTPTSTADIRPAAKDASATSPSTPPASKPAESDDVALDPAEVIDRLAGHPDDPQLPKSSIGASDEVLAATDPREVADVLQVTRDFAMANQREPRFMFALGRAALAHGYRRIGIDLLETASSRGSAAATAYLGYLAQDDGQLDKANRLLKGAQKSGFDTEDVRQALAEIDAQAQPASKKADATKRPFDPKEFNQPELIAAFYNKDLKYLAERGAQASVYGARIHSTIWEGGDILFMTENPKVLLELDPALSAKAAYRMTSSPETIREISMAALNMLQDIMNTIGSLGRGSALTNDFAKFNSAVGKPDLLLAQLREEATQDARRLVLYFDENPEILRRVYAGIKAHVR